MKSEVRIEKPSEPKLRFTFSADERLKRKKTIDALFEKGFPFRIHPIKVYHLLTLLDSKYPVQVLVGVSKKSFKKAVDRNRVKRLLREAYRKNKHGIYSVLKKEQKQLAIAFIYQGERIEDYLFIEDRMKMALNKLVGFYEDH